MNMSSNKRNLLDPGLCRCCKSIKKCRYLTDEYIWLGTKEVYADMMMDSFGLVLSYLDGEATDRGVCATCVGRLRDAYAFRKQVLQCEEAFLQAKLDDKNVEIEVKPEPVDDCDDDKETTNDERDDNDDVPQLETDSENDLVNERETRRLDEKMSKKLQSKMVKQKKRISKKMSQEETPHGSKSFLKNNLKPKLNTLALKRRIIKPKLKPLKEYTQTDQQFLAEDNLITIIENSYAYPFNNRSNNYYCFYCKEFYAKPDELRIHTMTHNPKAFKNMLTSKKFYYLDITRVDCRLCSNSINSINELKIHLITHNKTVHDNIEDRFIQFKLTFTDLVCSICSNIFFDFNAIVKHMVEHYSNFTCDICGLCFLEETRLIIHMRTHKDEKKHPCEICGKIFKSKFYKDMHVDTVHNKIPTIRCPKCEEMFLSYTQKNKHLVEVHGLHKTFPCNMCDKVYDRCKTLTEHQRRTHLKVLKHRCEYCDQRFYLPSRLKEHMATHTGERNGYVMDI